MVCEIGCEGDEMRPSWWASCRRACAFSVRVGDWGVGEGDVGEGGACFDFSRASIASEAMFFSLSMLTDKLLRVCRYTHR